MQMDIRFLSLSLFPSLSLAYTHSIFLFNTHKQTISLSCSLSQTHTHHTHTYLILLPLFLTHTPTLCLFHTHNLSNSSFYVEMISFGNIFKLSFPKQKSFLNDNSVSIKKRETNEIFFSQICLEKREKDRLTMVTRSNLIKTFT